MKTRIALLAGGDSSEREISLGSARQVAAALNPDRYEAYEIDVHAGRWTCLDSGYEVDTRDFSLNTDAGKVRFDCALIMIHGNPGENGRMQGYLDMMGIPYPSSGLTASAVTFDKAVCKAVTAEAGLRVARHAMLRKGESFDSRALEAELGMPLFVKPNASGSSCGVTKVKSPETLPEAVAKAFTESDEVLIEEFLPGREFGCGVLEIAGRITVLPITEIVAKNEFFDYEAKYTPGMSDELTPAPIPEDLADELRGSAVAAYKACRCSGIARVDFMVAPDGRVYLIEVNTVPGMSAGSIVPKQLAAAGMSLGGIIGQLIDELPCVRR